MILKRSIFPLYFYYDFEIIISNSSSYVITDNPYSVRLNIYIGLYENSHFTFAVHHGNSANLGIYSALRKSPVYYLFVW